MRSKTGSSIQRMRRFLKFLAAAEKHCLREGRATVCYVVFRAPKNKKRKTADSSTTFRYVDEAEDGLVQDLAKPIIERDTLPINREANEGAFAPAFPVPQPRRHKK